MKYKQKPIQVEALWFNGRNLKEVLEFCSDAYVDRFDRLHIHVQSKDFIVKDVQGEFHAIDPMTFARTFEKVK
ncbi:hypothetical protein [Enterococcus sp. AZ196]|uniref:hypothetical protein n=1 Tax=Enterococcus sp. AZ196 TaxID=2774659 RepID=UPI003D29F937